MPITPPDGPGGGLSAGDVTEECIDIRSEGVTPAILQTVYLDTQVARRRSRLRFKIHEVRFVHFQQDGHYRPKNYPSRNQTNNNAGLGCVVNDLFLLSV